MKEQKKSRNKRGVFFSLDALIALSIIILSITVIYPIIKYSQKESYVPEDIIGSLSALKIGDMNTPYVQTLRDGGFITDLNKSILEQIGEFYVSTDVATKALARELAQDVLLTINTDENIGIWYNNELLASKNTTSFESAKNVDMERHIISGIKEGNATTGYSARAFLTNSIQTKYYYFGGYVGEGNITLNIEYNGSLSNVELEITANKQFNIYVNDKKLAGFFQPADSEFEPEYFPLQNYISNFTPGSNTFKLVPVDGTKEFHVAGGYLKLTYEGSVEYEQAKKQYFPGIDGVINLYDGFYVPGTLNELNVYLHFKSNYTLFLNIGNTTFFVESSNDYENHTLITDTVLKSKLDYNFLSNKTIPIRLALSNASYTPGESAPVDIVFLIDSTGSMGEEIKDVKNIITDFTKVLENVSIGYRLGLVEFKDYSASPCGSTGDFPYKIHTFSAGQFTTNVTEYRNKVNTLIASGGNDYPESHLRAINESITLNWRPGVKKYEIMLTDAPPHAVDCTYEKWNNYCCNFCMPPTIPPSWYCSDFCNTNNCILNILNTDAACNLGPKYVRDMIDKLVENQITFYLINKPEIITGSSGALCQNRIMDFNMTNETGGKFYSYTESEGVEDIILDIAGDMVSLTYAEQIANITGNISSKLYPDSYIEFNYTKEESPYGMIITEEKRFSDSYTGSFTLPLNSSIIETKVISYSGSRWTKDVSINNNIIYNLSEYGSDYIKLGDPYAVNIPNFAIEDSNIIRLTTGTSPTNSSEGSLSNKIIYTILKDIVSYSTISEYANGCNWTVQFEDNTYSTFEVPSGATETCYYKQIGGSKSISYSTQDTLQIAVRNLFEKLDLDNNGKLDIEFAEQNLQVTSFEVSGIPFPYETIVQVRKWW